MPFVIAVASVTEIAEEPVLRTFDEDVLRFDIIMAEAGLMEGVHLRKKA